MIGAYSADRSIKGKVRRRAVRLLSRRPARVDLPRPLVSFAFDDAPQTAADTGAALLEQRGLRGTYFISAGLAGEEGPMGLNASLAEVTRLAKAGHEIAGHTHSHLDCGHAGGEEADQDAARNDSQLRDLGLPEPMTFAYPYGDVSLPAKQRLSQRYALLRALHHGLIADGADLNQAPAVGIEGDDGEAVARTWLGRAVARKAWLILYTHDVSDTPSAWGCTPGALSRLIDEAVGMDCEVVTVAEGCRRIGVLR